MASPILNVTELWVASTGEILDQSGTSQFHAQNNYANLILVNLEDGIGYDSTTLINFTPQTKTAYTSHWFYMSYQGLTEHEVNGEIRSFAQYAIRVPRVVLQNSNKNGFTVNDVVVKQTYGTNFIGQFATLAELNSEYPPTEALDDDNSIAYVISPLNNVQRGFYQVELDGTYGWTLMDNVALALESKQYNQFQIQVQVGSANPNDVVSVSAENVTVIMGILNNLQIDIDRIDANIDEIEDDAILLEDRVSTNEDDIDLLEGRATVNEEDIDLLEGRATNLETFQSTTVPATYETISNVDLVRDRVDDLETFEDVTVPATYETISNVDLVRDRVDDLETFEDVTVPATYETKTDAATHKLRTTALEGAAMFKNVSWDSTTGVITFTRYDDTFETVDLPTEMIFDTVTYDDVNMQLVFTLKNGTSFTVPIDDILTGIATQDWVVLNYYNKTQGDARYVTKDITTYTNLTAEENKTSARIYVDDAGVPKKMTLAELFEASNSSPGAFAPNGVYEDLTSGYAIKSQSGIDIDEEFTGIKAETRNIGTETITYISGKVVGISSPTVNTTVSYGTNGDVIGVVETYADGKSYETTYTKDVEGRIKTMTKAEV